MTRRRNPEFRLTGGVSALFCGLLLGFACLAPAQAATAATAAAGSATALGGVSASAWLRAEPSDPAGRKKALDRELDGLRESLEGTSKSLIDAAVALKTAQSDLLDANAALDTAHAASAAAQAKDDVLAGRLAVAQAALGKAQRDLAARSQEEADTRRRLGGIAREAYVSSGLTGLSIVLSAQSPGQFADQVNVAGTALRDQNGAIARLEVQQADTRARRSRLSAVTAQVSQLKQQSAVLVRQRQDAEQAASAASTRISRLVAVEQRSVKTIAARKAAEQKRLATLRVQENQLADVIRKWAEKHDGPVRRSSGSGAAGSGGSGSTWAGGGSGKLSFPVRAPITSGFGRRFHPILHIWRLHAGTDFGAPCGTPVHAAAPGRVVRAGWAGGFGNQVVIDHGRIGGKDIATSYNHLSKYVVRGGTVRRGQLIAYSGTTGLSTGCHLHFEVYVNGVHVNPMGWL